MSGISESEATSKTYYGHLSENRIHDQVYTAESIQMIIQSMPQLEHYVVRSGNATHFKCAQCFYDLQQIANKGVMALLVTEKER